MQYAVGLGSFFFLVGKKGPSWPILHNRPYSFRFDGRMVKDFPYVESFL